MQSFKEALKSEKAQVSMEFILLAGSVVVAAIIFWSLSKTFNNLGAVVSNWVAAERNISLARVTR